MLTPKQYIIQKSNQLPLDCCYINADWEAQQMASIFIFRKHTNGNHTFCNYLIDLKCLGVKDTFFNFNDVVDIKDVTKYGHHIKVDYNLVHNIIYAGYEYALEFDLAPHRDFEITKHFLLPDDEVPIIEIAVGDEHGNPVFIPYKNAPYLDIVKKLEKNPGKGNYTFMLMPDEYFGDDDMFEKFEDENEDEESKKAKRMYAEMNEEIDATTHDMDSKETLTFYKFIVTSFKTKNDGEQDDNLSASEQEDIQLKTVTEMATLLVSKFNDKFYDEKPITISDLMLH